MGIFIYLHVLSMRNAEPSSSFNFLIIDDDEDDRFLFAKAVKKMNVANEIAEAWNGMVGIQQLKQMQQLPDVIFLDLNMPVMNGHACLKQLKQDDHFKSIPVVIYSTSNYPKDIELSLSEGAAFYITKPLNLKLLPGLIESALEYVAKS